MDWEVVVVDDAIHNAVYIAGGKILFYMPWWSFRRMSDAQIATTIGHEVGHAESRHYAENWIKPFWAICLLSILSTFFPINHGHGKNFHLVHLWRSWSPEIVNCSVRTGLDMLTKHYAEAIGFDVVFFLPDSEDDFASYTEFLCYLGAKNRAGVTKLDDVTTLFLVPPSDFLTKVLNVTGPERLYGVVLKLPQVPSGGSMLQQSHQPLPLSQYIDRQHVPQNEYGRIPRKERVLQLDYNKVLNEDSKLPPKSIFPPTSESLTVQSLQSVPQDYALTNTVVASQAGVTLTPELIATLASLLPANTQSSASESALPPLASSTSRPSFPASVTPDKGTTPHGWRHHNQSAEQTGHPPQQLGSQFNPQAQLPPQAETYPTVSNTPSHSMQVVPGSTQIQDRTFNLPQQGAVSRSLTNFAIPSQSGRFAVSQRVNQQYQFEAPHNAQNGYGVVHGTDAPGFFGSPVLQQPKDLVTLSNQIHGANFSQPQSALQSAAEKVNLDLPNQVQQLQSALGGAGQGTSEVEVDKSQRYQSTLQFAASLLLQIQQQQQQQQQQTSTQAGQGSGHQQ